MKKISQAVLLLLCSAVLTDNAQAVSLHKTVQAHQEVQKATTAKKETSSVHKEQIKLEVKNLNQNGKKETKQAKAEVKQETKKQAIEQTQMQLKNNEQVAKKKVEEPTVSAAWVAMAEGVNEQEYMAPEMDALKEQQVNQEFENPHADDPAKWTLVKEKPVPAEPVVKEQVAVVQSHVHPVVAAQQEVAVDQKKKHDSWHKLASSMDAKEYGASQQQALEEQEVNVEFSDGIATPVAAVQKKAEQKQPSVAQSDKIAEIIQSPASLQQQHDQVKATMEAPAATPIQPPAAVSQKEKTKTSTSAATTILDEKKAKIAAILLEPISQSEQARKIEAVDEEFSEADIETYGQQSLAQNFSKEQVHQSLMSDLTEGAMASERQTNKMLAQQGQLQKQMEDEYAQFSATLNSKHYDEAIKIQNELKMEGNSAGDELLKVSTEDIFKSGFQMFPQVANNQYVQDQLTYLEGAQENLNKNYHNRDLMNSFVATGNEVAFKLENQFKDFWNNPLPQ